MNIEFYEKLLSPFKHLWKLDDDKWVAKRKSDWSILYNNGYNALPKAEKNLYKAYFLTGEKNGYIPEPTMYLLTPIHKPNEAREFFNSGNFSSRSRERLMVSLFTSTYETGAGLDWYRKHMQIFISGVLGKNYEELEEKEGNRTTVYSPEPTYWCKDFSYFSNEVLLQHVQYHGVVDSVDYFVSALASAIKPKFRKRIEPTKLLELADNVLTMADVSETSKELAKSLKENEDKIKANWALNACLDN